jgi:hypothetical protein
MPQIDPESINKLLARDPLPYLREWLPEGEYSGDVYEDADVAVNIRRGDWIDPKAMVEGKGLISLYAYLNNFTDDYALKEITKKYSLETPAKKPKQKHGNPQANDGLELVVPIPADAPPPPQALFLKDLGGSAEPSFKYEYRDAEGDLLCYVYRFNASDYPKLKRKEFKPLTLWRDKTGKLAWLSKAIPENRPMYGLDMLARNPSKPVLVVSGEKCVDAVKFIFGKKYSQESDWPFIPATWGFGDNGYTKTDFRPLLNREITYWPDNDESCPKAMLGICEKYAGLVLDIEGEPREEGWDVADLVNENLDNKDFDLADYVRQKIDKQNEADRDLDTPAPASIFAHKDSKGRILSSIKNLKNLLNYYKMTISYNVISKRAEFTINNKKYNVFDSSNNFLSNVKHVGNLNYLPKEDLRGFLSTIASENPINPVLDWIHSKKAIVFSGHESAENRIKKSRLV